MNLSFDMTGIVVAAAVTLRMAIIMALLPLLSQRSVPVLWRLALAGALGAAVAPSIVIDVPAGAGGLDWRAIGAEGLRSLLIGAQMAFVIGIPFAAVKFAGEVLGVQMGLSLADVYDPGTGGRSSAVSTFYYLMAVMLFFAVDAHHTVIMALVESCRLLPPFAAVSADAGSWLVVTRFSDFFRIGLQVAAPCIIVLMLVSAAMGVIVKTVPQLNVLIVGMPLKIAVGLGTIGVSLAFFNEVFGSLLGGMERQLSDLLGALQA